MTPGKGLLTATEVKEEEAPPNGVMMDDAPPKGVRAAAWLLKLLLCVFMAGEWPIRWPRWVLRGVALELSGRYFSAGPLSSLLRTQPMVEPAGRKRKRKRKKESFFALWRLCMDGRQSRDEASRTPFRLNSSTDEMCVPQLKVATLL
ncbi:hypothetical protein EYF80_010932 [Liparis tanakae]|uniref:Uncharacterized protein n=1 Tax=Liparis tanakae TaxID=230148 RepID=A0A4Z2ING4_9TELE|nr:hypothetical protein EYF80_010932 [Liparis tanakae]